MKKRTSTKEQRPIPAVSVIAMEPLPAPPLKRQSRYDRKPWNPGETPANPLMRLNRPLDLTATPHGQGVLGVEKPTRRGAALPKPKEGLFK